VQSPVVRLEFALLALLARRSSAELPR